MEYKEILKNYYIKKSNYENKKKQLDEKINKYAERISILDEKRSKLINKSISWIDGIVIPLAKELSKKFNMDYEIFGPFGLCCETSIYLKEYKNKSITKQTTYSITLEPHSIETLEIVYRTGERTNKYPVGSIGELNGFDCITKPLPDTIDEIAKLMRRSEACEIV